MRYIESLCKVINDVYESIYINKSIIVLSHPKHMFCVHLTLTQQHYPVRLLMPHNFQDIVRCFNNGNVRTLVMSSITFSFVLDNLASLMEDVTVVFTNEVLDCDTQTSVNTYASLVNLPREPCAL